MSEIVFLPLSILVALGMLAWDFHHRRVLSMFWFLSLYFSLMVLGDVLQAPIAYPDGYIVETLSREDILQTLPFMFFSSLLFAVGELIAFWVACDRKPSVFWLSSSDRGVQMLVRICLGLFIAGGVLYVPQVYGYSYEDYVSATDSSWRAFIFMCSMPLIVLWMLQKKYKQVWIPLSVSIFLVLMLKVRSFLLFSVVPALVVLVFQLLGSQRRQSIMHKGRLLVIVSLVVLLGWLGAYVSSIRTGEWHMPENLLTKGMYLVFQQVSAGMAQTGNDSMELAVKSVLYPVYNRFVTQDFVLPEDPAEYMAEMVTGRLNTREGFRHFPLLWYSEAYVSFGASGVLMGLLWGFVLGLWEAVLRKDLVGWALCLPFMIWVVYILFRGAAGHAFFVIGRNLYVVLFLYVCYKFRFPFIRHGAAGVYPPSAAAPSRPSRAGGEAVRP